MPHIDLLELPYFEGIALADLVSLIDAMPPRQFAPGSCLISAGDPTIPPLYVVTKGEVVVREAVLSSTAVGAVPGRGAILARYRAPTLIGEVELLSQSPARATVEATTQVSSFLLEPSTFATLCQARHPALLPFVLKIAGIACSRLGTRGEGPAGG